MCKGDVGEVGRDARAKGVHQVLEFGLSLLEGVQRLVAWPFAACERPDGAFRRTTSQAPAGLVATLNFYERLPLESARIEEWSDTKYTSRMMLTASRFFGCWAIAAGM